MTEDNESFCAIDLNRTKIWKNNLGQWHRTDGPAVERSDGSKHWYVNKKCHRLDGPALNYSDGSKYWYINDIELTEEEFESFTNNFGMVWNEETKIAFKLIYQT